MILRRSLHFVLSLATVASAPAAADEAHAFYGKVALGSAWANDLVNTGAAAKARFSPQAGWTVAGAAGYRFAVPVRAEIDLGYRRHAMAGIFERNARIACGSPQIPCLSGEIEGGRLGALSAIAFAAYDISIDSGLTPYVGAGAGLVRLTLRGTSNGTITEGTARPIVLIDDADVVAAYRLGAGLRTTLDAITLTLEYAYTVTSSSALFSANVPAASFAIASRAETHALLLGAAFPF